MRTENYFEDVVVADSVAEAAPAAAKKAKKKSKNERFVFTNQDRYALAGFIFVLPFLLGFAFFKLAPFIVSIRMSFSVVVDNLTFSMQNVGWYNYVKLFTADTQFITVLTSTVTSSLIELPIINISAFFFSILLNLDIKGRGFFRAVFFFPVILGTGVAMQKIMSGGGMEGASDATNDSAVQGAVGGEAGEVDTSMTSGIQVPKELLQYFGDDVLEIVTSFMNVFVRTLWKTGVQTLIFLTGLQNISPSLYESAYCDGATQWEMFWKITLPMMTPMILVNMVYTVIARIMDSDNPISIYFLNRQGSAGSSTVLEQGKLAAIGWVYAVFVFLLIGVIFLLMRPIIKKTTGRDM